MANASIINVHAIIDNPHVITKIIEPKMIPLSYNEKGSLNIKFFMI